MSMNLQEWQSTRPNAYTGQVTHPLAQKVQAVAQQAQQPTPDSTWTPPAPLWKNALGALRGWSEEMDTALPQWFVSDVGNLGTDAMKKWRGNLDDTAGAQMVKGSPLASGSAKLVGGMAPWAIAGAATGGVADELGIGAEALGSAPTWAG